MTRRQRIIGIVLGALLFTFTSWAEDIQPTCWNEELIPVYLCVNVFSGTTRFANQTLDIEVRSGWIPACRRNEELIQVWVVQRTSRTLDFPDLTAK